MCDVSIIESVTTCLTDVKDVNHCNATVELASGEIAIFALPEEYERLKLWVISRSMDGRDIETMIKSLRELCNLLSDPLLVPDAHGGLRPVKGTTRKEIYEKILKAQYILGIPDKWYPDKWRECQRGRQNP